MKTATDADECVGAATVGKSVENRAREITACMKTNEAIRLKKRKMRR